MTTQIEVFDKKWRCSNNHVHDAEGESRQCEFDSAVAVIWRDPPAGLKLRLRARRIGSIAQCDLKGWHRGAFSALRLLIHGDSQALDFIDSVAATRELLYLLGYRFGKRVFGGEVCLHRFNGEYLTDNRCRIDFELRVEENMTPEEGAKIAAIRDAHYAQMPIDVGGLQMKIQRFEHEDEIDGTTVRITVVAKFPWEKRR